MAEYIEREKALAICDAEYQKRLLMLDYCGDTVAWNIGGEIRELPAADVAPVVRCKDCKYGEFVKRGSKYSCRKVEGLLNFCDFYCKDGVKKEGDT